MNAIIVTCPHCGTRNKIPAAKQHLGPKCGRCKQPLDLSSHAVPVELSDAGFRSFIGQATLPVLVDFFSPSCGPCRMLAPTIDRLAKLYYGRMIIAKLDTSVNPQTAMQYQIRGVPALLFFRHGQEIDRIMGAVPEQALAAKIETIL